LERRNDEEEKTKAGYLSYIHQGIVTPVETDFTASSTIIRSTKERQEGY
jgi:hypothetical protein